jgi:hypothetical protein
MNIREYCWLSNAYSPSILVRMRILISRFWRIFIFMNIYLCYSLTSLFVWWHQTNGLVDNLDVFFWKDPGFFLAGLMLITPDLAFWYQSCNWVTFLASKTGLFRIVDFGYNPKHRVWAIRLILCINWSYELQNIPGQWSLCCAVTVHRWGNPSLCNNKVGDKPSPYSWIKVLFAMLDTCLPCCVINLWLGQIGLCPMPQAVLSRQWAY